MVKQSTHDPKLVSLNPDRREKVYSSVITDLATVVRRPVTDFLSANLTALLWRSLAVKYNVAS